MHRVDALFTIHWHRSRHMIHGLGLVTIAAQKKKFVPCTEGYAFDTRRGYYAVFLQFRVPYAAGDLHDSINLRTHVSVRDLWIRCHAFHAPDKHLV